MRLSFFMIIDTHCHLLVGEHEVSTPSMKAWAGLFAGSLTKMGRQTAPEELMSDVFPEWVDPQGRRIIKMMDEAAIDRTVILGEATDFDKKDAYRVYQECNRGVGQVVKQYPQRLVFFCGVYPPAPNALDLLEQGLVEWGAKGVKLDPLAGEYYPTDKAVYPLYEKMSALNLPIVMHTGPRPENPESKYAHPSYIDQVLADFPNLTIVAAHMGFSWWRDLIQVAQARPKLMCDISALQMTAALNYGQFCHILRKVMDGFGSHRMMFGTDGPYFDLFLSKKDWVHLIRNLPRNSPEGIDFTEEEVTALLGGTAERLFASIGIASG